MYKAQPTCFIIFFLLFFVAIAAGATFTPDSSKPSDGILLSSKTTTIEADFSKVGNELLWKFVGNEIANCITIKQKGSAFSFEYDVLCKTCGKSSFQVNDVNQPDKKFEMPIEVACNADVILVTNEKRLTGIDEEYQLVLKEYIDTLAKEGLSARYDDIAYDYEKCFSEGEKKLDFAEAADVKLITDRILEKSSPKYFVILGGPAVIPMPAVQQKLLFFNLPKLSPLFTDRIYAIKRDTKYFKDLSGFYEALKGVQTETVVARIPDDAGSRSTALIKKIIKNSLSDRNQIKKPLILSDASGSPKAKPGVSQKFVLAMSQKLSLLLFNKNFCNENEDNEKCLLSPPYCSFVDFARKKDATRQDCDSLKLMERLSSAEALFIIAHGSGSGFYAENERASYVIFDNSIFSAFPSFELKQKPLIITTACYGGSLAELTVPAVVGTKIVDKTKPPLVPIIMRKGGLVYIGSTSVLVAPTIFTGKGGNVMFSEIIVNALKKGKTIGAAFLEAQNEMSRGGFFAMEGSYEIQLYGDPTLKFKIG